MLYGQRYWAPCTEFLGKRKIPAKLRSCKNTCECYRGAIFVRTFLRPWARVRARTAQARQCLRVRACVCVRGNVLRVLACVRVCVHGTCVRASECLCVRACVRASVGGACARASVCLCARVFVRVFVRACMLPSVRPSVRASVAPTRACLCVRALRARATIARPRAGALPLWFCSQFLLAVAT